MADQDSDEKAIRKELVAIKKLLILLASKSGATQPEIGRVLGIGERHVRRMIEKR